MPLIAIPFKDNGKLGAIIYGCTEEEYEEFMKNPEFMLNDMNSVTFNSRFIREYLEKNGCDIEMIPSLFTFLTMNDRIGLRTNLASGILNIRDTQRAIRGFGLSYNDFIDAYAEYLKSAKGFE